MKVNFRCLDFERDLVTNETGDINFFDNKKSTLDSNFRFLIHSGTEETIAKTTS